MRYTPLLLIPLLFLSACNRTQPKPQTQSQTIPVSFDSVTGSANSEGFLDESVQELEEKIRTGDMTAAFRLGAMYHDGMGGVTQDFGKARRYFLQAAEGNDARAAYNLGVMFLRGEGTGQNDKQAVYWFQRARALGNVRAPYQLGQLYYQGKGGLPKDPSKAKDAFQESAYDGMPESQYNLAMLLIRGEGGKQDVVSGYAWLLVSKGAGYASAKDAIAKLEPHLTPEMKTAGEKQANELTDQVGSKAAIRAAQG